MNKIKKCMATIGLAGSTIALVRVDSALYGSMNPMLALIFYAGQKLGKIQGLLVGLIATVVSSVYTGFGPWCLMQAILWSVAGFIGGCISKKTSSAQFLLIYGFMFGVIMDAFCFYATYNLGYPNVGAAIVGGLPFDVRYSLVSVASIVAIQCIETSVKAVSNLVKKGVKIGQN